MRFACRQASSWVRCSTGAPDQEDGHGDASRLAVRDARASVGRGRRRANVSPACTSRGVVGVGARSLDAVGNQRRGYRAWRPVQLHSRAISASSTPNTKLCTHRKSGQRPTRSHVSVRREQPQERTLVSRDPAGALGVGPVGLWPRTIGAQERSAFSRRTRCFRDLAVPVARSGRSPASAPSCSCDGARNALKLAIVTNAERFPMDRARGEPIAVGRRPLVLAHITRGRSLL